jgi:hypothetical protein
MLRNYFVNESFQFGAKYEYWQIISVQSKVPFVTVPMTPPVTVRMSPPVTVPAVTVPIFPIFPNANVPNHW